MRIRYPDTVVDQDNFLLFQGNTDDTVSWLEQNVKSETPMWVYVGENGQILSSSEYLDLAT